MVLPPIWISTSRTTKRMALPLVWTSTSRTNWEEYELLIHDVGIRLPLRLICANKLRRVRIINSLCEKVTRMTNNRLPRKQIEKSANFQFPMWELSYRMTWYAGHTWEGVLKNNKDPREGACWRSLVGFGYWLHFNPLPRERIEKCTNY